MPDRKISSKTVPYRFLIIGAGFSGCVLARELAERLDCQVDIWDERDHPGGNCHTERDAETGVMVHRYGPHIFNTDKKEIWDYVNRFSPLMPYIHRVKGMSNNELYSLPVNLNTINQFFRTNLSSKEAEQLIAQKADKTIGEPENFEEQALKFIGPELYRAFFYGYTKKQWGCEPAELPASILQRIPIRFDYNDNYHLYPYTGIPLHGYTAVMKAMINHPSISLHLNRKFESANAAGNYQHIFYTGAIDAYFGYRFGRLGYRTVMFEKQVATGDHQGVTQINYCDEAVPYTRITEHKHFAPWEQHDKTVYFTEYSKETGAGDVPYYPKRLKADKVLLQQYRALAEELQGISFLGRLATYRYMDMHHVIDEAISFSDSFIRALQQNRKPEVFPNTEKN